MGVSVRLSRDTELEVVAGSGTNLKSYSVQEDSTPIDPSSSAGGVGQITVTANSGRDSMLLLGEFILSDGSRGKTTGVVKSLTDNNGDLTITADSILSLFNSEHIVKPYTGTLSGAIQYYSDLVGIPNDVTVDATVASRSVIYPGWNGNVWVSLKQLLAKEQVEMALVFNRVIVRPLRTITANMARTTLLGWSADNRTASKKIEIYYYNHRYTTRGEIYPLTTEEPQIYQVDANETVTFTQQLNASLVSVNQPSPVDFVFNQNYSDTNGVYSVVGNDGLPITAAQWSAQGGSVQVKLTDDPNIIDITITGARSADYAPYRIAMSSGASNFYNSLHITGVGVLWDKKLLSIPTGATNAVTGQEVGVTVDNPFISTLAQAYTLGARAAGSYAGVNYVRTGTAYDINRDDASRDLIRATVEDFNTEVPAGRKVSGFNTDWAGQDVADFNAYWQAKVDVLWENQLFGNAAGARVITPDVNFRIDNATTSESSVQFTATLDTTVADFNARWAGGKVSGFNSQFNGKLIKDFSMIPLRRT